jgi:hypothetical protein
MLVGWEAKGESRGLVSDLHRTAELTAKNERAAAIPPYSALT